MHKQHAADFGDQPGRVASEASERYTRTAAEEKTQERAQAAVSFARERLGSAVLSSNTSK